MQAFGQEIPMAHPLYAPDNNSRMRLDIIRPPVRSRPQTGRPTDAVALVPPPYATLSHAIVSSCGQELPDCRCERGKARGAGSGVSDDEDEASQLAPSVGHQCDESADDQLGLGTDQGSGGFIRYVSVVVPAHGQLEAPERAWDPRGKLRSEVASEVRDKSEEAIEVNFQMFESMEERETP